LTGKNLKALNSPDKKYIGEMSEKVIESEYKDQVEELT
jgi:hypothetical protein